ncbi:MAG: DUF2939 domain-containing protein [Hyphomicrobium sp.]
MIGRLLAAVGAMVTAAVCYAASPMWTAWSIREAVTRADTSYLERKIDWPQVRETMRQSMTRTALDLPDPETVDSVISETDAGPERQGLWSRLKTRVKAYAGRRMVDKMVDSYVTARGLPQLYKVRSTYGTTLRGETGDAERWLDRFRQVWARVMRAEFTSWTVFQVEMRDQFDAERSFVALLELRGAEWILTELRVRSLAAVSDLADAR